MSLRKLVNVTISLPFDMIVLVKNILLSILSFVKTLVVLGFKLSMYGPIACLMIDDLSLLDKAKEKLRANANIRSTLLVSLAVLVTILLLGLGRTAMDLTSLIVSVSLPVINDVVFSAFFATTAFGTFVVYVLSVREP